MRNDTGFARDERQGSGVGSRIRQKRAEQNISQEYLAEKLGVSRQSISKWENGQSDPSTKKLGQLAQILHMDVSDLIPASAKEKHPADPGILVGIEVQVEDFDSLRCFFDGMPEDIYDNYNTSLIIYCQIPVRERARVKKSLEQQIGRPIELLTEGATIPRNSVCLLWCRKKGERQEGFFRMLARRKGADAVGVVLSGGQDGFAEELQELKAAGALLLVRETNGLPGEAARKAAVQTGMCDYIVSADEMGKRIAAYIRKRFLERVQKYPDIQAQELSDRILDCLLRNTGVRFHVLRDEIVTRGLLCRLEQNPFATVDAYARYLEASAEEQNLLAESILETAAGRRSADSDLLLLEPIIAEMHLGERELRIWFAGCRDGLGAYLLAMLLCELLSSAGENEKFKIFATDVELRAVNEAADGIYGAEALEAVSPKWQKKYFEQTAEGFRVVQSIRSRVIFSVHDMLVNPPFSRLDLLVCRGILKNLKPHKRRSAAARFSYALRMDGCLVLGSGESPGELEKWFSEDGRLPFVYRKIQTAPSPFGQGILPYAAERDDAFSLPRMMSTFLMAAIPSGIIFNDRMELLYTGREAGGYLKFRTGIFTRDLFENLQQEIGTYVKVLVRQMQKEDRESISNTMTVEHSGSLEVIRIFLVRRPIFGRDYYMLWFGNKKSWGAPEQNETACEERTQLEQELRVTKSNLYQALQELDAIKSKYDLLNEEFQSSNEELSLINEELQSSNFELETSNRELTRLNAEYQKKICECSDETPSGDEVLSTLGMEAFWMDENLCICKMTEGIMNITNLRRFDLGRSAGDLVLMDGYPQWKQDLAKLRSSRETVKRRVCTASRAEYLLRLLPEQGKKKGFLAVFEETVTEEEG